MESYDEGVTEFLTKGGAADGSIRPTEGSTRCQSDRASQPISQNRCAVLFKGKSAVQSVTGTTDEPERTSHSQDERSPRDMVVPPSFPFSHCPLVCPLALRPHAAGLAVPCQAAYPEAQRFHPFSVCLARLLPVAAGLAVPRQAACR